MADTPAEPADAAGTERTIAATRDGDALHGATKPEATGPDLRVGALIDSRYRITRKLGDGGMGAVYEADNVGLGGRVAVKFLHAHLVTDADVVRRFLQEARAAASIGHPGIVRALDVGRTAEGAPFLALELLDGHDLFREITARGRLPVERAVRIAREVAAALGAAHAKEIVHRDLKPENIFLAREEASVRAKVLDFGISKIRGAAGAGAQTQEGTILGTPAYMAPEQLANASEVDARADIYALGGVLYAMLTGKRPFESATFPGLVLMIMSEKPASIGTLRDDVPPALVAVVERAMARVRDDRYADMAALDDALAPFDTDAGALSLSSVASTPEARSSSAVTDPHAATVSASGRAVVAAATPAPAAEAPRAVSAPATAEPRRKKPRVWRWATLAVIGAVIVAGKLRPEPAAPTDAAQSATRAPEALPAVVALPTAPEVANGEPSAPLDAPTVEAPPAEARAVDSPTMPPSPPVGAPTTPAPSSRRVRTTAVPNVITPSAPARPTAAASTEPRIVSASSVEARALFPHVAFCWRDARDAHQLASASATVSLAAGSNSVRIVGPSDSAFRRCVVSRVSERMPAPEQDLSLEVDLPGAAP